MINIKEISMSQTSNTPAADTRGRTNVQKAALAVGVVFLLVVALTRRTNTATRGTTR